MSEQIVESKLCKHCWTSFDITDADLKFYNKISPTFAGKLYQIPTPTLCPDCRQQRRFSFRNERNLYKRKCDLSNKDIISVYSPDKKYKVYDQKKWRSDERNPLDYWRDFDFTQPFFKQFDQLLKDTPRISLNGHISNDNSEYVNYVVQSKNCYMCFGWWYNESVCYSTIPMYSKYCLDSHFCFECENCYETSFCKKCSNIQYWYNDESCRDSYFIENCEWCNNCFGCDGLINQSYCIFNKKVTPEDYKAFIQKFINFPKERQEIINQVKEKSLLFPKKSLNINFSENCLGNNISHSNNCINCHTTEHVKNAKWSYWLLYWENVYDSTQSGINIERIYEIMTCSMQIHNCRFCMVLRENCNNLFYCSDCNTCSDCFWCIGLKQKQYCILNKQYTKDQYEIIVSKIIEKMIADKERWEFFPSSISQFGYNETIAMETYPLTKEEAIKKWFKRNDYEAPFPVVDKTLKADELPSIQDVTDDILQQAIQCEITKKPFRIIKSELEFYRKHNVSLPTKHPDQRHLERMTLKNSRKLRDRKCAKCWVDIKTTYSPEKPEIVYCESCYTKEVYG